MTGSRPSGRALRSENNEETKKRDTIETTDTTNTIDTKDAPAGESISDGRKIRMDERYDRTKKMTGDEGLDRLRSASVLIVGIGGVGSYAAEAVARSGIGSITLMDGDSVQLSNLNRQLVALTSTIGDNKAEVMAARIGDIDPDTAVTAIGRFYRPDDETDLTAYDWVIDAIDDVDAKTALIQKAAEQGVNIVSAMGAAGKLGTDFKVADLAKTQVCPLARVMRRRLRDAGIEHVPVVYSEEKPQPRNGELGSISYVPGSAGLTLAGYVIRQIAFGGDKGQGTK